jgi:predicted nucleic acid-binding protein
LIIDEKLGRKVARQLGIPVMGSIGLLEYFKKQGWIEDAAEVAKKIRDNGYFYTDSLIEYLSKK